MGTRADFYVGRGENAEWLGSIAWDGNVAGIPRSLCKAVTEDDYRMEVSKFLAEREDASTPETGWPWPWDNSTTTDYIYAFDGWLWVSCFGSDWLTIAKANAADAFDGWGPTHRVTFPDMSDRKTVTFGKRSGLITLVDGRLVED